MALINCPECNSQVSSKAKECPECGHPIKEDWFSESLKLGCITICVVVVVLIVLFIFTA